MINWKKENLVVLFLIKICKIKKKFNVNLVLNNK
jgi:hypothetical protein